MTHLRFALLPFVALAVVTGCGPKGAPTSADNSLDTSKPLAEARKGFATKLTRQHKANKAVDEPPAHIFHKISYDAPLGKNAAYLTPDPKDGQKHPAIVWLTGGDCNTIDASVWKPAPVSDDQTAKQYRDAGLVMMFPSLRGGNQNPGSQENFYGEVDDVLAAAAHLAKLDFVDPKRIYLGGHSTGGTLVLLVAEVPNPFRAVFAFGPAHIISGYPEAYVPAVNTKDDREVELRSPLFWLEFVQNPTFVFEGAEAGNADALGLMERSPFNKKSRFPKVKFFTVTGAGHFSVLAPVNGLIARKIAADTGAETNLSFTRDELNKLFGR